MLLISIISSILAGMGIGGGALFVILSTLFLNLDQKYSQALNLLMFIAVSMSSTFSNIKDKKVDFNLAKKTVPFLVFGAIIGTSIVTKIDSNKLKNFFTYFMVIIGFFEIITSLIRMKKAKNITRKNRKE